MDERRARVISQEKGSYRISSGADMKAAAVSGKYRYEAVTVSDYPAVGDYVLAQWPEDDAPAVIRSLFPRKSCFIRRAAGSAKQEQVVAANIDTVLICMSLNQNYHLRRLERYLSIAYDSGAAPVVVLTKAHLCRDVDSRVSEVRGAAPGVDILAVSSLSGDLGAVTRYILPGRTVAFLGSSGVGRIHADQPADRDPQPCYRNGRRRGQGAAYHHPPGADHPFQRRVSDRHPRHAGTGHVGQRRRHRCGLSGCRGAGPHMPLFKLHPHLRARLRYSAGAGGRHAGRRQMAILSETEAGGPVRGR